MNSTWGKNFASVSASDIRLSFCDSVFSLCSNLGICGRKTGVGKGKGLLAATRMQCLCLSTFWWGCFPFKGVHIWLMNHDRKKDIKVHRYNWKGSRNKSSTQTLGLIFYQAWSLINYYNIGHIGVWYSSKSSHLRRSC